MDSFGEIIRKLREQNKLPLRTVAAYLDIDQAILSKMERGNRRVPREQVVKLAKYYNVTEDFLIIPWLSDKIVFELLEEELYEEALKAAEEKIVYKRRKG